MPNIDSISRQNQPQNISPASQSRVSLLKGGPASPSQGAPGPRKPKRVLKKILVLLVMGILIFGGVVVLRAQNISDKIFVGKKISFFQKIKQVLQGGQTRLSDESQINILLLGIGGE